MGEVSQCDLHLDYTGETCPDCGLEVDQYGNTEVRLCQYCSFLNCGCDGSRLWAEEGASERALKQNV